MILAWIEGGSYVAKAWVPGASYAVYAYFILTVELTVIASCIGGR